MKMLGQDLHTQQEFDEFHKNEFAPLVNATSSAIKAAGNATKAADGAKFVALISFCVSLGSLAVALVATMPK